MHELMHDFSDRCDRCDRYDFFCNFLVCGVGAGYGVGGVRFRHEGGTRIPDAVTALLLALAFLRLLATLSTIGTAATATPTTAAAAFFALRFGCGRTIDRCAVDGDGGIHLRHVLRSRRLRGRVTFRTVAALLVAALIPSFITATALLLTFVAVFAAGFALRTLAALAATATPAAAFTAAP